MTRFQLVLTLLAALICALKATATDYSYRDLVDESISESDTFLNPEDFERSKSVQEVDIKLLISRNGGSRIDLSKDPLLRAGRFEGDIAGINGTFVKKYITDSNKLARNAVKGQWRLWQNAEIPYVLSTKYGHYSKSIIAKAIESYHANTCVRFKPRDDERDYLYIHPDDGCYSLVGRVGGRQPVSLDAGCIQVGTVIHELMHAVGFFHEQSRADRDDYIEILYHNVDPNAHDQFEKYGLRTIQHLGVDYDYSSIMHYGPYAFSKNGRKTISPRKAGGHHMGQRDGFTKLDILKINRLYQCEAPDQSQQTSRGVVDPGTNGNKGQQKPVVPSSSVLKPVQPVCEDQSWRCKFWKFFGYCDDQEYKVKCPKSCNNCAIIPPPVTTPTAAVASTSAKRTAINIAKTGPTTTSRLSVRSTVSQLLSANSKPTRSTAPLPAGGPSDPYNGNNALSSCTDQSASCSRWATNGYCRKAGFVSFMRKTCAVSCGLCTEDELPYPAARRTTTTAAPDDNLLGNSEEALTTDCRDKFAKCHAFALKGYCSGSDRGSDIVAKYCPKSCGKC